MAKLLPTVPEAPLVTEVTGDQATIRVQYTDLGISDANRQWAITAYALAFGGLRHHVAAAGAPSCGAAAYGQLGGGPS
ncbi:hypothetical protein OG589_20150 [Sphaerisporangium sp. NBC_01403]|uniref:hypothetical protein n=1 Tax=Sphaerisporangium sp. NBC_01403 TaxID=2903599 RepID=UPI00324D5D6C